MSKQKHCPAGKLPGSPKARLREESRLALLFNPKNEANIREAPYKRLLAFARLVNENRHLRKEGVLLGDRDFDMDLRDALPMKREWRIILEEFKGFNKIGDWRSYIVFQNPLAPILKLSSASGMTKSDLVRIYEKLSEVLGVRSAGSGKWWYDPLHAGAVRPLVEGEWPQFPPCKGWEVWDAEDI